MFDADITDAVKDRLRDSFLFAFAAASVEQNWQFLYYLARSDSPPMKAIVDARPLIGDSWVGWSFLFASIFAGLFPLLQLVLSAWRAFVRVGLDNVVKRIELGRHYTLSEIEEHYQYKNLASDRNELATTSSFILQTFGIRGIRITEMADPREGFTLGMAGKLVPPSRRDMGLGRPEGYVFKRIGNRLVLLVEAHHQFPGEAYGIPPWRTLWRDGSVTDPGHSVMDDNNALAVLVPAGGGNLRMIVRGENNLWPKFEQ